MKPRWWDDHKDAFASGAAGFAATSVILLMRLFV